MCDHYIISADYNSEEEQAATSIQAGARGYLSRKNMKYR